MRVLDVRALKMKELKEIELKVRGYTLITQSRRIHFDYSLYQNGGGVQKDNK